MKATKREAIVLEWYTLWRAIRITRMQRNQFSRELWYIPTVLLYLGIIFLFGISLQKKTPTESECERENQELRTQVDKLLLEEQKERICPPLELQRAGSNGII